MRSHVLYTTAVSALGAITLCYISYYVYRRKRLQHPPKNVKWQFIGNVEELTFYPVRSGAPIILNELQCKTDGVYSGDIKDRSLLLYNENDKCIYAGTYPIMLSITAEVQNKSTLLVKAAHAEPIDINLDLLKRKTPVIKHKKGIRLYMIEGEMEHHKWFSEVILKKSHGLKLFINVKTEFVSNLMGEDKSYFNPVMVMNDVSVNDLNHRLPAENKANHLQFRGNLLIKSADNINPYDEDNWTWLRFGAEQDTNKKNCILRYKAPCLRCILPNVNIKTFQRNRNFEPLKTLKKYRLVHNSKEPTMGAHYNVYQEGVVKSKDPVYAIVS